MVEKKTIKIAIIGVYYGTFPEWIQYWLKSCESNEKIDFFIVTDIEINCVPKNVHIINMNLKELKELAEQKLGMEISLDRPYKMCDYKPVYGIILEDYLKEYDYWGHCDFDMIFGDIMHFIQKYDIKKYDKFLHLGHLALYRNTTECNNYYKLSGSKCGDYEQVFKSGQNHGFDETGGIYCIYKENQLPMFEKRIFAEIKTFHKRFRLKKSDTNYRHQVFYFENGKIYRAYIKNKKAYKEEYIYIHFRRKLPANNDMNFQNIENFYITNEGFFRKEDNNIPNIEEIEKYNNNPGLIKEALETIWFCVKNFKKMPDKMLGLIKK